MGKIVYGGHTYDLGAASTSPFLNGVQQAVSDNSHRYLELRYMAEGQEVPESVVNILVGPGIPIAFLD
ncbi:hypothetical protein GALAXY_28 [Arthrobacter phage Galaxy]|uniref:Uncharacterized protein n=1 Tax=Arthrobacter phage Galaxy TaxID=1772326 RepID=A0A0U4KMU8_9CAUD|nr:hypothetical protein FDG93_gp28 [Arthrobacter phage Galaxy]ALY08872.1 hypothetical protein GALAXY_28 [Arthrobacter phage Galaxy]